MGLSKINWKFFALHFVANILAEGLNTISFVQVSSTIWIHIIHITPINTKYLKFTSIWLADEIGTTGGVSCFHISRSALHISRSQQKVSVVLQIPRDHLTHKKVCSPYLELIPQLPFTHSTPDNGWSVSDDPYQHRKARAVFSINPRRRINLRFIVINSTRNSIIWPSLLLDSWINNFRVQKFSIIGSLRELFYT